jgi:hypothetical protein
LIQSRHSAEPRTTKPFGFGLGDGTGFFGTFFLAISASNAFSSHPKSSLGIAYSQAAENPKKSFAARLTVA